MRLTQLSITNYRALRDVTIPLSRFGCLIGENNSGKSSFLQALSLFFSGSKLAASHFFDEAAPIRIAVTFEGIGEADLARLAEEHRTRVAGIVKNGRLVLVRAYGTDGKSALLYNTLTPTDARFSADSIAALVKGQRAGQTFVNKVVQAFPELDGGVDTSMNQDAVKQKVQELADSLPDDQKMAADQVLPTGIDKSIEPMLPDPIFSGGEPFLNFDLLLHLAETAKRLGIPTTFVETNGFWCTDDETARERLTALRRAGLDGVLISANPFILEHVPFERTQRAVRIAQEIFGDHVIVYQPFFFEQFRRLALKGTLAFEDYLRVAGHGLQYVELFPSGRAPYKLAHLYEHYPAERFFGVSCRRELIRDWHVYVDNYGNFIPGYCGGLSLGDAQDLEALCRGVDLEERPVLQALLTDLKALYDLGWEFGYQQRERYISKCHLCVDVRRHLALEGEFKELRPRAFYERLED